MIMDLVGVTAYRPVYYCVFTHYKYITFIVVFQYNPNMIPFFFIKNKKLFNFKVYLFLFNTDESKL